jgi:16S rRNA (cytosine967-C5)-methyltransferase
MALDPRAAAAKVIADVLGGKSLNQALPPKLEKVAERERGLLQQLCYGSLRHAPRLEALLAQLLKKPLKDKDRDIQGLLLCGLYQLESTRIPDHAAVSSTVAAVAVLKKNWAKGMTNAVLRRFLRERESLEQNLPAAAAASHPEWLHQLMLQQWPARASDIIAANNLQPPMVLRVNTGRVSREAYLEKLASQGIEASPGLLCGQAIYLSKPCDVAQLPGFADGEVSVQDEAAQLAAHLLQATPGERILDACAAPGGKACHVLELQPQLAELVAMDSDELRLQKILQNLQRLQLAATVVAGDACKPPATLATSSFDRILVDAPCSATGVIRRHPDVKLLRRATDIGPMADVQLQILTGLWPLLKPGGALLYATCSVLTEENSELIARFLGQCPDAGAVQLEETWGEASGDGRQLLPSPQGPDGLFYALLQKRA